MTNQEQVDFYSGKDEVELTTELISKLVKDDIFPAEDYLLDAMKQGFKYNVKRNSIVGEIEEF